jgi:hypothetical protein
MIFLGQPFTLQLTLSDTSEAVQWVSAQIAGKARSLKPSTEPFLQSLVSDALGGPQNAPFFGHVMSGSRMIASNFTGFRTFTLTVLADHIPASYDGAGLSISYELLIASQIGGTIDKSRSFPLFFIGPGSKSSLRSAQQNSLFEIESAEGESAPGRLSLQSPFRSIIAEPKDFLVQREGGIVAALRMPAVTTVGTPVVGVISLENADSGVAEVKANLVRIESFGDGAEIVSTEIGSHRIEVAGVISKRFSIPVPFATVADFETEIVKVSHTLEFTFYGQGGAWKWAVQIAVLPPELSLTKPRVVLT